MEIKRASLLSVPKTVRLEMHSISVLPGCQQAAGEETQSQTYVEKHFGDLHSVQLPRLVETKQYFTNVCIMSADKYPSIFSRQMEAIVLACSFKYPFIHSDFSSCEEFTQVGRNYLYSIKYFRSRD